jgi:hypothetical protein
METREEFLKRNKRINKGSKDEVLGFIYDFITCYARNEHDYAIMEHTFMSGYCYYFANMLKIAFCRGKVCWCAPYSHFVWLDEDNVPYDIEGASIAEAQYYIPEQYIKEGLDDFKHVPGKAFNATKDYINNAILKYEADCLKK